MTREKAIETLKGYFMAGNHDIYFIEKSGEYGACFSFDLEYAKKEGWEMGTMTAEEYSYLLG